jgi:histidyl-tRNA synthetase
MIQSLRGMKDIIGDDSKLFLYFIENCSKIASKYGFEYIETPLLEETSLFKRSVGNSSDIVNKEMYQFIDKGQNDVCLRPEGTAGVVRSFIQNKLDRAGGIHRYFYYGAMFRYERPQKGRLREFHQFGCESFGVDSVYEDANIIMMIHDILEFFGIRYKLQLNSLGCDECMPTYRDNLKTNLETIKEHLCEDCNKRIITNPIRVLDCKNEHCKSITSNTPKIVDNLCSSCHNDFEKLKDILTQNGIEFQIDTNLVRGLDYYSKSAFEFVSDEIGAQSAIAGGGRYDKLVEFLDGRATPAVGFAIGIERLLELIKYNSTQEDFIYLGAMNEDGIDIIFNKSFELKKTTKCFVEYKSRGFKKHLNIAQKLGCNIVALIGEDEIKNHTIWTKNIITGEEKTIYIKEF